MAKTPAEFQTIEEIHKTALILESLAKRARLLANSLKAAKAGGAKIVGRKHKDLGLAQISNWIDNGVIKLRSAQEHNHEFGVDGATVAPVGALSSHDGKVNGRTRKRTVS